MEPTQQQIYSVFKKLPLPVRTYIASVEAADDIATLGKNKGLNKDQISKLAKQAGYFLMNIVPADALAGNIQYELYSDAATAETLAEYIKTVIQPKSVRVPTPAPAPMPAPEPVKAPEPAPNPVPIRKVMPAAPAPVVQAQAKPMPAPAPKAPEPEKIYKLDDNLPAVLPEREVTIRKIVTENAILNKQLEVPIVHPLTPAPRPIVQATTPKVDLPLKGAAAASGRGMSETQTSTVTRLEDSLVTPPSKEEPAPIAPRPQVIPPQPIPATPKVTSASIVDAHLKGTFSFPKKEIDVTPQPQKKSVPVDPYREPIE